MVAAAGEVTDVLGVLGWAVVAKSCFLTDEGVGWLCVAPTPLLLGDAATTDAAETLGLELVLEATWSAREAEEAVAAEDTEGREELEEEEEDDGVVGPPAPVPCFGELLLLPGLTGRTGKGPQVPAAAGENVPPNWAMGRRGCRICCMVWAASSAS